MMLISAVATAADDPGGWSKAKWGMTEQQILAAFGHEAVRLNPPEPIGSSAEDIDKAEEAKYKMDVFIASVKHEPPPPKPDPSHRPAPTQVLCRVAVPVELAQTKFRALMIPDTAGRLASVLLSPVNDADSTDSLFDTLEQLLVQKYGRPWSTTDSSSVERQWTSGQTVVTLLRLHGLTGTYVTIHYTHKTGLDKL
jgi:hypothetical protein